MGGTAAGLQDLAAAALVLDACGNSVRALADGVAQVAASADLAVTAPSSPASYVRAQQALLGAVAGPGGLTAVGLEIETTGAAVRASVASYRAADLAAAAALDSVRQVLARAVGRGVPVAVVAAAPVVLGTVGVAAGADLAFRIGEQADRLLREMLAEAATGRLDLASLDARALLAGQRAGAQVIVDAASVVRQAGAGAGHAVVSSPAAVEQAVAGSPGLFTGLVEGPVSAWAPAAAAGPGAGEAWAEVTGAPWPPRDVPGAARLLTGLGAVSPALRDGPVLVRAATSGAARRQTALTGTGDLVTRVAMQSPARAHPAGRPAPGQVRVERIARAGGHVSWVVEIPGTQSWDVVPPPGSSPMDLTTNVHALAGAQTAAMRTVAQAMHRSGVLPGQPVLLAGNSQGGMTAAGLAADQSLRDRFTITHVVTIGSPVATFDVPDDVRVLSLEHQQDVVPSLDGAANPDRPSWVTVRADAAEHPDAGPQLDEDPLLAHDTLVYVRAAEAVDRSDHPSLQAWRQGLAPFLDRPGTTVTTSDWIGFRALGAEKP